MAWSAADQFSVPDDDNAVSNALASLDRPSVAQELAAQVIEVVLFTLTQPPHFREAKKK